jgi:hypothetical protein
MNIKLTEKHKQVIAQWEQEYTEHVNNLTANLESQVNQAKNILESTKMNYLSAIVDTIGDSERFTYDLSEEGDELIATPIKDED